MKNLRYVLTVLLAGLSAPESGLTVSFYVYDGVSLAEAEGDPETVAAKKWEV